MNAEKIDIIGRNAWKYFQSQLSQEEKGFFGGSWSYLTGLKPFLTENVGNFNPREVKKIY